MATFSCASHDRHLAFSHLCGRHCSNFFRSDACDVSSIQASQHQKMGPRGSNRWRLDFNWNVNSLSVNTSGWKLALVLMAVISLPLPFCYLYISYTSIALKFWCGTRPPSHGAANRQRKLTVTLFMMTIISLLLWLPYVVYNFVPFSVLDTRFSFLTYLRLRSSFTLLRHTNSLVNPIIYTIRIPEFRKALLILFKRRQRQNVAIPLHAR